MSGAVTVRDARPDERGAIAELTIRAYAEYATIMAAAAWAGLDAAMRSALAQDAAAEWIVAVRDGSIVGSVLLYPARSTAYGDIAEVAQWPELRLLAVTPEARGQGVGRLLVEECIRRARAAGADSLGLHTSASMRTAMALYRAMGFERTPEHDFQPSGAELVEGYRLRL